MSLQAMIMAGGEGVRLRPMTVHTPKPLSPLLGEPVMGYALKLLRSHGVTHTGVTLWYQPQKIRRAFGKGEKYGVQIKYFEEKEPLGTAGSVKMAQKMLTDTFFVLSGDGLTDCDLTAAMKFHREKKALATLVLKRVPVPLSYGVVLTDGEGRVTRFIEKPGWNRAYSDLVNTGVYILEPEIFDHIPDTGMPDFGKDIFPALLSGGLPVYGWETAGYWCDVGDQRAYLMAQRDLLEGKVNLPCEKGVSPGARVHPSAVLEGECQISEGAVVSSGATLKNAVIGRGCLIGPGAKIENSCLWQDAVVQEKASVDGSVICDGAIVRPGAEISDGCALGRRAVAGAYALLRPGVKIWPHLKVAPGAVVSQSVTEGDWAAPQWTDQGADCDSAEGICSLCQAYVKVTGAKRALAAGSRGTAAAEIAAGAMNAAGVRVLDAGIIPLPMFRSLIISLRLDGGVYARGQAIQFFGSDGQALSYKQTAAMDACVLRQDVPPPFTRPAPLIRFTGAEDVYLARIVPRDTARPLFSPLCVFSDSPPLLSLAGEALRRLNAREVRLGRAGEAKAQNAETGFLLSESGDEVTVFTESGALGNEQKLLLLYKLVYLKTGALYEGRGVPRAAEKIAPLQTPRRAEDGAFQRTVMEDGLAALLLIADALKGGPIGMWLEGLPETHLLSREIACSPRDKSKILRALCEESARPRALGNGVTLRHEKGYATIVPDDRRAAVRVFSESSDSEFARELCDFYIGRIQALTGEN